MGIEEKIREHLLSYRAKHNKTQKGMADLLDVSTVTYQEMEKGIVRSIKGLNKLKEKTGFRTQETVYDKAIQ